MLWENLIVNVNIITIDIFVEVSVYMAHYREIDPFILRTILLGKLDY